MMEIYHSSIQLTGSYLGKDNPLPFFRSKSRSIPLRDMGLLPRELEGFGYETGFRVLPYTMQDSYGRAAKEISLQTFVLQNDCLKATFLPGYGGRLYSLFDIKNNRELLYINPVFQPANLALRNAWFSGGIEWNIGNFGHAYLTCSPVFFAVCRDGNGEEFLRMYEYERCKGFFYQIDFHLPDGSGILFAHVSIWNTFDRPAPIYWWTNTAVEENRNVRVFSSTREVIYLKPRASGAQTEHGFSHGKIPYLDTLDGADASYPENLPYSNEYFFQNSDDINDTWEAAVYHDGAAFWERSTPLLRYRKMFCWGNGQGGRHWQEFLSKKGSEGYLEIQAGLSPTQVHGRDIGPKERWSFTQAFGGAFADARKICGDWTESGNYIHTLIDRELSPGKLRRLDKKFDALVYVKPGKILHSGSGWGALEALRDSSIVPRGMIFDRNTLTGLQRPWLELLEDGRMRDLAADEIPVSWMVDARWMKLLEKSLSDQNNRNSAALLHYGIMLYENGRWPEGLSSLRKSFALKPTAICALTIAQILLGDGNMTDACAFVDQAVKLGAVRQCKSFSEQMIKILNAASEYERAWKLYESLPGDQKDDMAIMVAVSNAAFSLGKWDFIDILLSRGYAQLREGDNTLSELWYRKKAVDEARARGVSNYEDILDEIKNGFIPPYHLNFQMGLKKKIKE